MAAAKEGIVKRTGRFIKEVRSEMKKVTWPMKSDLTTYTMAVFVAVFIVGALLWVADTVFYKTISFILR